MQFDASAGQRPARPATDLGDDTGTTRRIRPAPGTRPAREDDQLEPGGPETELLESEQLFRTMFERSVVGLAHVDLDGRWLRFNQRFCDILGYSREELASRTFQDVTHPDDLAASLMCLQRVLTGELEGYELVAIDRASRPFPCSKPDRPVSRHPAFRTRPCDPYSAP